MIKARLHPVVQRTFLGYSWLKMQLTIAHKSIERLKNKVRMITKRNRGRSLEQIIRELNLLTRGWMRYFKLARYKWIIIGIDKWLRRKIRCYRIKQCKNRSGLVKFLVSRKVPEWQAWIIASSGKGWWRKSNAPQTVHAMTLAWFEEIGLLSLQKIYEAL